MADKVKNLPHTAPEAADQAREQATEYDSVFRDTPITLNDGTTVNVPPHPDLAMLSDEAMEAYEELQFEMESYAREDDIPEQRLRDDEGNETGIVIPGQRGALKRPYRKVNADGVEQLVKPPHSVKVAQIDLGEADYGRLVAGGKSAADVWRIWGSQSIELRKRQDNDSKSS